MDEWNLKKDREDIWAGWGCKNPYHRFFDNLHLVKASQYGLLLKDCIYQRKEVVLIGCILGY